MESLDGKVAIVTGSATGIGAATAQKLAESGCLVVINYSKSELELVDLDWKHHKDNKHKSSVRSG